MGLSGRVFARCNLGEDLAKKKPETQREDTNFMANTNGSANGNGNHNGANGHSNGNGHSKLSKEWAADPRWEGVTRPYTRRGCCEAARFRSD